MPYKDPDIRRQKQKEASRKSYLKNKAKKNAESKKWAEANQDRMKELQHEWYQKNKDKVRTQAKEWAQKNPKRTAEMQRQSRKKTGSAKLWKQENSHKVNQYSSKRRAIQLDATPDWLTLDDFWLIEHIYEIAKVKSESTKVKHEVDHIVPLVNPRVSGLHVPWNLQIITAYDNRSKGNKLCI